MRNPNPRARVRHYVMASLDGEARVSIPTAYHTDCDHLTRVCTACADTWQADYTIHWEASAAGESLRAMIRSGLYPTTV